MNHQADLDWVRDVRSGELVAFRRLYETFLPPVAAFARKKCAASPYATDRDVAELTAAILTAVFDHLDGYTGRAPLAAWVLAVARLVIRHRHAVAPLAIAG